MGLGADPLSYCVPCLLILLAAICGSTGRFQMKAHVQPKIWDLQVIDNPLTISI